MSEIVKAYFEAFNAGNVAGVLACLTDDRGFPPSSVIALGEIGVPGGIYTGFDLAAIAEARC